MCRFPLFVDIRFRRIVVVGAGTIASRRVRTLLAYGARPVVVAREACAEIKRLAAERSIELKEQSYESNVLAGAWMVLACTDQEALNRTVCQDGRKAGALANNCSSREDCDFFFPSVVKNAELSVGITGTGSSHRAVREARMKIEELLGGNDADYDWNQGESAGIGTE